MQEVTPEGSWWRNIPDPFVLYPIQTLPVLSAVRAYAYKAASPPLRKFRLWTTSRLLKGSEIICEGISLDSREQASFQIPEKMAKSCLISDISSP